MTYRVVMDITKPIYGNNHHVYMDNYFSSPNLFSGLADKQCGACGTLRVNRKGVPAEIKTARPKKNDPPVVVRDGKLLFISWTHKRLVNVVTTLHNGSVFLRQVQSRVEQGYHREVVKPMAIELYTQNMGGIYEQTRPLVIA